ncbi:GNAT family N-acetyltransferase [Kitasatospora sp. NPDC004289]
MRLERLCGSRTASRVAEFTAVYRTAFAGPPWHETEQEAAAYARRLATDLHRPGFRAVLAGADGTPAGFATAWPTPRPFPTGRSYDRVRAALGDQVESRLAGTLEVDELAVAPHARGQGLAGRLLDLLCEGQGACWLLTSPNARDAVRLYERHGWQRLPAGPDTVVFTRSG